MNSPQRIVLIASFLIILGMALFPPWVYVFTPTGDLKDILVRTERPAGYHLLFSNHQPTDETALLALFNMGRERRDLWYQPWGGASYFLVRLDAFSVRLDTSRLLIQIGVALLLTAILYLALRSGKSATHYNLLL
jgi:hypothetical protein